MDERLFFILAKLTRITLLFYLNKILFFNLATMNNKKNTTKGKNTFRVKGN